MKMPRLITQLRGFCANLRKHRDECSTGSFDLSVSSILEVRYLAAPICAVALLAFAFQGLAQTPPLPSPMLVGDLAKADPAANQAWANLETAFIANAPAANGNSPADMATSAIAKADLAESFYEQYPSHPRAIEARKYEIFALLDGAIPSNADLQARLSSRVAAFRANLSFPEKDRAIVAGSYDFHIAPVLTTRS